MVATFLIPNCISYDIGWKYITSSNKELSFNVVFMPT